MKIDGKKLLIMDYKKKLALAKEALDSGSYDKKTIEYIFPELTESEDKENREGLIAFIRTLASRKEGVTFEISEFDVRKLEYWADWLEKQSEQKIPKFKAGDSIQYNGYGHNKYTIKEICGVSHYINTDGGRMDMSYTDANFELIEQKPIEFIPERKLRKDLYQLVYDCAWSKVTCKVEGESKEEYAERYTEQILDTVRDWADDYIDDELERQLRKSYDRGKKADTQEQKFVEWTDEDERIRKELIEYLVKDVGLYPGENRKEHKWLRWLEKQKDYNSINYKEAEKEKKEHVSNGFMLCEANYQDFKEGEHYWLEYLGDDKYNVRSDNLLGKTYHITPQALYLTFRPLTWLEKRGWKKSIGIEPFEIEHGKYYYCIQDYYSGGNRRASKGDVVQALRGLSIMALGDRASEYFLPVNHIEQKPEWSEEDEYIVQALVNCLDELKENCGWNYAYTNSGKNIPVDALKSWLEKQGEKKPIEWKQDNVEELTDFENAMMHIGNSFFGAYAGLDPNNTETIKEQANLLLDLVNVEWTEEDNVYLEDALWAMKLASTVAQDENDMGNIWCAEKWLQSLPKKYLNIEKNWNQTEEQIEAVSRCVD